MRLQDKIVLITGAGSGLGRESALLFAREGATVVVTDVRSERAERVASEIGAAGGKAIGLQTDVRSEQAVAEAVDTAVDQFGRLDVMYANAGTDELIRTSGAGVLVPTGDIEALSRAFEQVANDRAALAEMASKGLATARMKRLDATHRQRAHLAASLATRERVDETTPPITSSAST